MKTTRRQVLKATGGVLGLGMLGAFQPLFANRGPGRFKIGACDWSLGMHSDIGALQRAKEIGLDGVQVSLGKVENNMHLRQKNVQKAYKKAAKEHGVEVGGLAIGEMNSVPYKSNAQPDQWVSDSIDVAKAMGVKVVLLAFFGEGDLKGDQEGTKIVIEKLKKVAPKAEGKGITLGIESWLSAKENMEIVDAVGSDNVKVYYDVANSLKMGYDIYEEIRWLGDEICEIHMKENGYLLGEGEVDFEEVRKAIDDINYKGWLVLEGSVPEGAEIVESYKANQQFLRSMFIEG